MSIVCVCLLQEWICFVEERCRGDMEHDEDKEYLYCVYVYCRNQCASWMSDVMETWSTMKTINVCTVSMAIAGTDVLHR